MGSSTYYTLKSIYTACTGKPAAKRLAATAIDTAGSRSGDLTALAGINKMKTAPGKSRRWGEKRARALRGRNDSNRAGFRCRSMSYSG